MAKKHGCLFSGCLFFIILFLCLIGLIIGIVAYLHSQIKDMSSEQPASLPKVEATETDISQLAEKVEIFKKGVESGQSENSLSLTAKDLNILISKDPKLKDRLYITLEKDRLKADCTLPLDGLNLKGRYLNLTIFLKASLENGSLNITIDSAQAMNKPVPLIQKIKQINWAEDIMKNQEIAKSIAKWESIQCKDGVLVIQSRSKK